MQAVHAEGVLADYRMIQDVFVLGIFLTSLGIEYHRDSHTQKCQHMQIC